MIDRIVEERCDGCGWCIASCRMDLIGVDPKRKKAFFTSPDQCVVCYSCVRTCPQDAIRVGAEKPSPFPSHVRIPQLEGNLRILARGKVTRHETCDVAVVGAGISGLTAAIWAASSGASVTVFDKALDIKWTNTSMSGGSISFAKEREMYPEAKRLTAEEKVRQAKELIGDYANTELVAAWRHSIDKALSFLRKQGLQPGSTASDIVPSVAAFNTRGQGSGLNKWLLSIAQRLGCRVVFSSRAVKLLTDKQGNVMGLRVITPEGLLDCTARAVVLAAAGFQANPEMVKKYLGPEFALRARLTGSPFSIGDGHLLAVEVGAKFTHMEAFHCRQLDSSWVPGSTGTMGPRQLQPFQHYGIFVNKLGKRFIDEYGPFVHSDTVSCSIIREPQGEVAYVWDQPIKQLMGKKMDRYSPEGIVFQTNTLEEMALKIGCPPQEFSKTVEEYNAAAQQGKAGELDVPKSDHAYPLEHPPFYAISPVWAGHNATFGGPAINARTEVLDERDVRIPGLYAVGENAGGFFYGHYQPTPGGLACYVGNYQVTTSSLGYCIAFGRIAGIEAASHGSVNTA